MLPSNCATCHVQVGDTPERQHQMRGVPRSATRDRRGKPDARRVRLRHASCHPAATTTTVARRPRPPWLRRPTTTAGQTTTTTAGRRRRPRSVTTTTTTVRPTTATTTTTVRPTTTTVSSRPRPRLVATDNVTPDGLARKPAACICRDRYEGRLRAPFVVRVCYHPSGRTTRDSTRTTLWTPAFHRPSPPRPPRAPSRRSCYARRQDPALGCALLLLIMSLTILRNDVPVDSRRPPRPTPAETSADPRGAAASRAPASRSRPYQQATWGVGISACRGRRRTPQVYDHAHPGSPLQLTFPQAGTNQVSSTFLTIGEGWTPKARTWYQIRVPARPNGSTGWVRASDVTIARSTHAIYVDLSDHRLDLYELGNKIQSYPVAVGRMNTPTALAISSSPLKFRPDRRASTANS